MRYTVYAREIWSSIYEVEADSEEEAIEKVTNSDFIEYYGPDTLEELFNPESWWAETEEDEDDS